MSNLYAWIRVDWPYYYITTPEGIRREEIEDVAGRVVKNRSDLLLPVVNVIRNKADRFQEPPDALLGLACLRRDLLYAPDRSIRGRMAPDPVA